MSRILFCARLALAGVGAALMVLASGCATQPAYDYTAFRAARPRSILVLPPVNDSTSVEASYSVWSQMTLPLAESGFCVFPVTLVDETFRQNGLFNPAEIAQVRPAKFYEIFGADAVLYTHVSRYGTSYVVVNSSSVVTADAKLVDLRSGATLWQGTATASSDEGNNNSGGGGIIGLLVVAIVKQVIASSTDASHGVAAVTAGRLLGAGRPDGILYGPRSPNYQKQ